MKGQNESTFGCIVSDTTQKGIMWMLPKVKNTLFQTLKLAK